MTRMFFAVMAASIILFSGLLTAGAQELCNTSPEDSLRLGTVTDEGIAANALLWTLPKRDAQPLGKEMVCIEVNLSNQESGLPIKDGALTLQAVDPDRESDLMPTAMAPSQNGFVAALILGEAGDYRLMVKARFPDNRTRHFEFDYQRD